MKVLLSGMLAVALFVVSAAAHAEDAVEAKNFPHIAKNQNRRAAEVVRHADGCTICHNTCYDPDTQTYVLCNCIDYVECGGGGGDTGCISGSRCISNYAACTSDYIYNGCRIRDYPYMNCTGC
ncbi:MAG TPA: hypothetical protein VEO54_11410 [Thermoanaerobaculia bacterium]|nr:hypothetical protein [Thermoanaerobaculia bacterium]